MQVDVLSDQLAAQIFRRSTWCGESHGYYRNCGNYAPTKLHVKSSSPGQSDGRCRLEVEVDDNRQRQIAPGHCVTSFGQLVRSLGRRLPLASKASVEATWKVNSKGKMAHTPTARKIVCVTEGSAASRQKQRMRPSSLVDIADEENGCAMSAARRRDCGSLRFYPPARHGIT